MEFDGLRGMGDTAESEFQLGSPVFCDPDVRGVPMMGPKGANKDHPAQGGGWVKRAAASLVALTALLGVAFVAGASSGGDAPAGPSMRPPPATPESKESHPGG